MASSLGVSFDYLVGNLELELTDTLMDFFIDEIIHYKEVTIEDKTAVEKVRLLVQLNEEDKGTVMNIIDTMLTKQKFKNFFEQNL